MKITLKKNSHIGFHATTESGHRITLDGSPDHGGENLGPRPMEMVLVALGSCSGIDVTLILEKSRQQISDVAIEIEGNRADSVPSVFTDIHVSYHIVGRNLDPKKVARAVSLSMEKYCSVTKMLESSVKITHSHTVSETD